jgi:hypothetical protein
MTTRWGVEGRIGWDGLPGYSTGDVLIARLIDTSGDGQPGPGDTVEMGRYPTNYDATAFGKWGVKSHTVNSLYTKNVVGVTVLGPAAEGYTWYRQVGLLEIYREELAGGVAASLFQDALVGTENDATLAQATSPGAPQTAMPPTILGRGGDDPFIDIVLNYPVP